MGVDGIKPKSTASTGPTVEAKKVEAPKAETPAEPVVAKKPSEGFDLLKKKIMSVSGRYAAPPIQESTRADLKDLIAKLRSAVQAGGVATTKTVGPIQLKNAGDAGDAADTVASKGKDPGPRPKASDFTARRDSRPISEKQAKELKNKGYAEASSGRAIEELKKKNPITGKDMMNAIAGGAGDLDNHAASSEFKDFKAKVRDDPAVWNKLPADAKANYEMYAAAAVNAQKAGHKGIPKADFAQMLGKMENATARAALEKDFGVKVKNGQSVEIGDDFKPKAKEWSTEELMRVHESFSNLPKADQKKLEGMDLIRDSRETAEAREEAGGPLAGEYSPNVDGERREIHLYDKAFTDQEATTEARKDSISVITHEAGHAVEGRTMADKLAGYNTAVRAQKAQNVNVEAARKDVGDAYGKKGKHSKEFPDDSYNKAVHDFGRTRDPEELDFLKKQKAVDKAIKKLESAPTDQIGDAKARLKTAQDARDKAAKLAPGKKTDDLVKASNKVAEATEKYAVENGKLTTLSNATTTAKAEFDKVETIENKTVKVMVNGREKVKTVKVRVSTELAAFNAARSKGGKTEAAVSTYGKKEPAEEYAEAYALYQRDPELMKDKFPKQYGYFHKQHQNAKDPD